MPAKGWKIEKKLRQVGSIDKIRIMAPKDVPPEAIQKEDGCELCKAGVRNKAFVCFRMPGARACLRCVQNKLKCSFNVPEDEDDDGDDEDEEDDELEDVRETLGAVNGLLDGGETSFLGGAECMGVCDNFGVGGES